MNCLLSTLQNKSTFSISMYACILIFCIACGSKNIKNDFHLEMLVSHAVSYPHACYK